MLFDDNIGFTAFGLPKNLFDSVLTTEKAKNYDILPVEEGFMRGNMYALEFKPYKNYTYRKLEPTTKRNSLLMEIMMYDFAVNDLNLCLDLHPDNEELLQLFKKYMAKACEKELEYVKNYGPLQLDEVSGNSFNWINDPWPWMDKEDSKYV